MKLQTFLFTCTIISAAIKIRAEALPNGCQPLDVNKFYYSQFIANLVATTEFANCRVFIRPSDQARAIAPVGENHSMNLAYLFSTQPTVPDTNYHSCPSDQGQMIIAEKSKELSFPREYTKALIYFDRAGNDIKKIEIEYGYLVQKNIGNAIKPVFILALDAKNPDSRYRAISCNSKN